MKPLARLICILFLACTFQNCNKEKHTYTAYVYSNKQDPYTRLKLFLNDNDKGDIPYFTQKVTFDSGDSLLSRTLKIKLAPDKYPFTVKDQWGNVKVDANVKVKRKALTADAVIGEVITTTKSNDVIIEVKYN
jgi:hypothetical protein